MNNRKPVVQLPDVSEEQATRQIRDYLKTQNGILILENLNEELQKQLRFSGAYADKSFSNNIPIAYHQVIWLLVSRGVLCIIPRTMPASVKLDFYGGTYEAQGHATPYFYYGPHFKLTPYGEQWLQEEQGIFNCLPTEHGRFSQFLNGYSEKFGDGFDARSREAVGCYKHRLYLSCCVMCGAAVESIILRVRMEQSGDSEEVVGRFIHEKGLDKVIGLSVYSKLQDGSEQVRNIRRLVKYWRDSSAHGQSSHVGEMEAFTALLVLLRLAHFVDENWSTLTETL